MMAEAPLMLGVSGLRGIVGESLTAPVAASYAAAAGGWLARRLPGRRARVVLGRDGRAGGQMVSSAARAGLLGSGCDVIDLGVAMTPTVGVMVDMLGADGGMIVTASHNPQQWNGLKVVLPGPGGDGANGRSAAPAAGIAQEIVDAFQQGDGARGVSWDLLGGEEHADPHDEAHVALVCEALSELEGGSAAEPGEGLKILLDSVNGSGIAGGAMLLGELGCTEVVHEGADAGGVFSHEPEPIAENLVGVSSRVRSSGAAVGFVQDPDADRLALIDGQGRFVGEELTLALAAESLLSAMGENAKGRVLCANLSTSRMIDDVASKYGARVVRSAVGEANVVDAMRRESAVLGGEGNGGVIWPRVTCVRDSLSGMALVLSLMARRGVALSELISEMPGYAIVKRKQPLSSKAEAQPAVERIAASYAGERVDLQDGVRVDFDADRSWVHVRASNTEPILRLIAEAPSADRAGTLLDQVGGLVSGG